MLHFLNFPFQTTKRKMSWRLSYHHVLCTLTLEKDWSRKVFKKFWFKRKQCHAYAHFGYAKHVSCVTFLVLPIVIAVLPQKIAVYQLWFMYIVCLLTWPYRILVYLLHVQGSSIFGSLTCHIWRDSLLFHGTGITCFVWWYNIPRLSKKCYHKIIVVAKTFGPLFL